MRRCVLLLPLALCSAHLAASPLPSFDFATQSAGEPRVFHGQGQAEAKPLNIEPRIQLGDLDSPLIEIQPPSNFAGPRDDPKFADSFSIGKSLNESGPVQLQPRNSGFSPPPAPRDAFPWPQLNIKQPGANGQQRAIPMHMLPPLPPQQLR
ncbi:hypothetical protein [Chromobacterium phragmitis]|uniref:hypothetical protein n=1 Tax=Chromobacterium phragmitis TaxID=2202141 RepID=UPI0011AE3029|nr:hypothetical protein [Chromobacterium phragmitis]